MNALAIRPRFGDAEIAVDIQPIMCDLTYVHAKKNICRFTGASCPHTQKRSIEPGIIVVDVVQPIILGHDFLISKIARIATLRTDQQRIMTVYTETSKYKSNHVTGIIVTYNPDFPLLEKLISAILPQIDILIIVDNGSLQKLTDNLSLDNNEIVTVELCDNYGIAAAQNIGIKHATDLGTNYFLLLDQDSQPSTNMVPSLVLTAEMKQNQGIAVACVGPRYSDPRQDNVPPFFQIKNYRIHRHTCNECNSIVEVDYLIASGCLIPTQAIKAVGLMREELFIDYVDIEWGLRAKQKGFKSFGVCAAQMVHQLGDKPIYFLGRYVPVHSPLRHYYHFRNAIWLYQQSWLNREWKVVDFLRLLRKLVFYSIFAKPQTEHLRMMIKGMYHGYIQNMGRIDKTELRDGNNE